MDDFFEGVSEELERLSDELIVCFYEENNYKKAISKVDEMKAHPTLYRANDSYKQYIKHMEACCYSHFADTLFDNHYSWNDVENKEAYSALLKAKKLLYECYDAKCYEHDSDEVLYELISEMMKVENRLGNVVNARNFAILTLDAEQEYYREPAIDVYNETTHELVSSHKFISDVDFDSRKYVFIGRNRQQIAGTYQTDGNERIVNWIFTLDQLPPDMVFPSLSRPQPGLYMAHPVKTEQYYPMKGVEETLFMEKVREFCWFVQCLGATRVSFHSNKGLSVSQGMGSTMNAEAQVGIKAVNIGGGYSNTMRQDNAYTSNQQVELIQNFAPKKKAYCPDDLIWLDSDPAWKMLLKQRLEGGIMEYTYKISSSETCQMSTNEMDSVKANFEYMMVKANGSYDASTDKTFSSNEETEWSIHVEFAPLEELLEQQSSSNNGASKLTDDESEYLEMVKECLEDGEIGSRERKLLDKIRIKNGISEERAKELESTLTVPQLTDDEKEYLEAFKDACEDGIVSDKQRRLLEKLRVMYGISEERAKQLENMK